MVIDKIRKMSVKGVKLKSESYFSMSPGVLELWRKNLRVGRIPPPPPGPDRVKTHFLAERSWALIAKVTRGSLKQNKVVYVFEIKIGWL